MYSAIFWSTQTHRALQHCLTFSTLSEREKLINCLTISTLIEREKLINCLTISTLIEREKLIKNLTSFSLPINVENVVKRGEKNKLNIIQLNDDVTNKQTNTETNRRNLKQELLLARFRTLAV